MGHDSRLIFIAKGVAAFFVFLVPFLASATYFGGGILGIEVAISVAVTVALLLLTLGPRIGQQSAQDSKQRPPKLRRNGVLCPKGPYTIASGAPTRIRLPVKTGNKINGYIEEIDGDYFDWYMVDEQNMVEFLNNNEFDSIEGDENVHASKVDCNVPHDGPWYLLLDVGSRRYDRIVEVSLRLTR